MMILIIIIVIVIIPIEMTLGGIVTDVSDEQYEKTSSANDSVRVSIDT